MTRLLIAEDEGMMRSALATLLALEDDLEVVAQVGRGDEVLAAVEREHPDVALLDIEMPGRSGLEVAEELRTAAPGCDVVVLTTFGRAGYVQRALAAGVKAFVIKDGPVEELARTIRRVRAGEVVVDPALATQALLTGSNPLTEREREVLVCATDGATIAAIAARVHLAPSTVRNYLSEAIGKTGSRNRMEAVRTARDNGWL